MKIGYTGPRKGMTDPQLRKLYELLYEFKHTDDGVPFEFHHGDCIGGDEQSHLIALTLQARIVIHPPIRPTYRAFCLGDEIREEKEYYDRDRDVVDETRILIGASLMPFEMKKRSGTWKTIRYARRQEHRNIVIWPDGSTT